MTYEDEIAQSVKLACLRAKAFPTPEHEESRRNALRLYERAFGRPYNDAEIVEEAERVWSEQKRAAALRRARSRAVREGRMPR